MGFGGGKWEVWMGWMSMPCGISQATAGGRDGAVVAHDGGKGGCEEGDVGRLLV